jgi:hypothetical protein
MLLQNLKIISKSSQYSDSSQLMDQNLAPEKGSEAKKQAPSNQAQ